MYYAMNNEENEIKIEYLESFEVDPLRFECQEVKPNTPQNKSLNLITNKEKKILPDKSPKIIGTLQNKALLEQSECIWHKLVDNSGKYVCKYCVNSYSTLQTLRHHVKTKHYSNYLEIRKGTLNNIRRRKLKCHICKVKFKNSEDLQDHSKTHSLKDNENFCFICSATFTDLTHLQDHMKNVHKVSKKQLHICTVCGYSTHKLYHFKQHANIHTNIQNHKCLHCDYSTDRATNLKVHEQIHLADKPYTCSHENCKYQCASKSALRSHELKHNKGEHMLYCDKCSYNTVYIQNLNKHLDSHRRNKILKRISNL